MGVTNYSLSGMILQVVVGSRRCKLWKSRLGAGNSKILPKFHRRNFGRWSNFNWRLHIFLMGWNLKPPTRRCCLKQIVEATPKNILVSRAHRIFCDWYTCMKHHPNVGKYIIPGSYKEYYGAPFKMNHCIQGTIGCTPNSVPMVFIVFSGILGDYNP